MADSDEMDRVSSDSEDHNNDCSSRHKTPWEHPNSSQKQIYKKRQRRHHRKRPLPFPFVEKLYGRKHLPLKMVELYELAALKGYFKYTEVLKYEHHLKKSLTKLNAGDDLENECVESRKHKYMDDDEPLSPIEETNEDDSTENPDDGIGARIVENSSFILSSKIPKRFKRKTNILGNKLGKRVPIVSGSSYPEDVLMEWSLRYSSNCERDS